MPQDDLIEQARTTFCQELGIESGELAMFNLEPPTPPQAVVVVTQAQTSSSQKSRTLGICMPWDYIAPSGVPAEGQGVVNPNDIAVAYFSSYENRAIASPPISAVQLIRGPRHGSVTSYKHPETQIDGWRYLPEGGYVGNDSIEFLVDVQGVPVHVVYFFKVTKLDIDREDAEGLCKRFMWKISLDTSTLAPYFSAPAEIFRFAGSFEVDTAGTSPTPRI